MNDKPDQLGRHHLRFGPQLTTLSIVLATFGLPMESLATYGRETTVASLDDSIFLTVGIESFHDPGDGGATKVSGSMCNFDVGSIISDPPNTSPLTEYPIFWTRDTRIQKIEVRIGSEWIEINQPPNDWLYRPTKRNLWKSIRFQTTYFPHNTLLPIELKVTAILKKELFDPGTLWTGICQEVAAVLSANVTVSVYNKLLNFHTQLDYDSATAQYGPGTFGSTSYSGVSQHGATSATGIFSAMNHDQIPSLLHFYSDLVYSPGLSEPAYKFPTSVFSFVHGESGNPARITDSTNSLPIQWLQSNVVKSAVLTRVTNPPLPSNVPHPNLALHYTCSTAINGYQFPNAYMMVDESEPPVWYPNRAFAGFRDIVYSMLYAKAHEMDTPVPIPWKEVLDPSTAPKEYLWQHSDDLLTTYAKGLHFGDALKDANDKFPPRTLNKHNSADSANWTFDPMLMEVPGPNEYDHFTTLMKVYITNTERQNASQESGYETPTGVDWPEWYFTKRCPSRLFGSSGGS